MYHHLPATGYRAHGLMLLIVCGLVRWRSMAGRSLSMVCVVCAAFYARHTCPTTASTHHQELVFDEQTSLLGSQQAASVCFAFAEDYLANLNREAMPSR
jgi:hypothetical protein